VKELHTFRLPEKVYGREDQIKILEKCLQQTTHSSGQIALISGPSGIGKTAIVKELFKQRSSSQYIFLSAKYDQINNESLAGPLVSLLSDYFKSVLADTEDNIKKWKDILKDILGINAKVLTDIVPEIEVILGPQPEAAMLGPAESLTRFEILFSHLFIAIGKNEDSPTVIFLDDLQWASAQNINLIHKVLSSSDFSNILFIGAFRDNEVEESHPLNTIIISDDSILPVIIDVKPITISDIKELLEDTLGTSMTLAAFADLSLKKTNGNPFHVREFLKHLHRTELINYDQKEKNYKYSLEKIEHESLTDNVVDILILQMKTMPKEVIRFITCCAAIGNKFSIKEVPSILNLSPGETFDYLEYCLNEQYFNQVPHNDDLFKFSHDRIQEAAYKLLDEHERSKIHARIAKELLFFKDTRNDITEVEIAIHLNKAKEVLPKDEIILAVDINYKAAILAKRSTAFKQALNFITTSHQLITSDQNTNRKKYHDIVLEISNLLYLNGKYDECEEFTLKTINQLASSDLVIAKLYNQLVIQYTAQGRYQDSIDIGRQALKILGIELPTDGLNDHVKQELGKVKELSKDIAIPDLAKKEEMKEEDKQMAMSILINLDSPCYLSNIDLYCIVVAKMVQLSIIYGPVAESAKGYASYGIVLCAYEEYELGYEFNQLGNDIADRYHHLGQICRSNHTMANHVQFWTEHIKDGDKYNDKGFIAGHDAGEYLWAGFIKLFKPNNQFWRGRNLSELSQDIESGLHYCTEHPNQIGIDTLEGLKIIVELLNGKTHSTDSVDKYINDCRENNSLMALSMFLSVRTFTLILDHKYEKAQELLVESEALLPYSFSVITNVYDLFSKAFLLAKDPYREDESDFMTAKKSLEKLSISCPENFKHLYLIILGIEEITDNNFMRGTSYLEEAARIAQNVEFNHIAAFSNELLAKEWNKQKKLDIERMYIRKASQLYKDWGAFKKVNEIENSFQVSLNDEDESSNTTVDSSSLVTAYELMGQTLKKDELLNSMLKVMANNLNADSAAILLKENAGHQIASSINIESTKDYKRLISYVDRRNNYLCISKSSFNDLKFYDDYKSLNRSILCFPLENRGIILLVNKVNADAFSPRKIELIKLYERQLSLSLDHIEALNEVKSFNSKLEEEVKQRTTEILSQKDHAQNMAKSLQDAQRKLIDSAKDAGRAEVASNVLHNVGNAVMTLTGYVELLETKLQQTDNETHISLIEKVRQKIELVMKLVKSEKQHIVSDSKVVENIDIERLIDDALIIADLDSNCKVTKNLETHDQLGIEYDNVKNIIINFFSNAKKACSKGENPAQIFVTARVKSQALFIEVQDNGIGMDSETIKKVFEPGFSTKETEGSGFGLHNSAVVAKRMNGSISAHSDGVGLGAKFTLKIPLES